MDFLSKLDSNQITDLCEMYNELFLLFLKKNEYDTAQKCFTKVKKYSNISFDESINVENDNIEKLFEQDKKLSEIFEEISSALAQLGAYESAIKFLAHAINIDNSNPQNYILLGDYYAETKNYQAAIDSYEKYVSQNQDYPEVYNALGIAYSMLKKYANLEKQKEYFEKAIELSPDYQDAIRNLAITYREMGNHDKCLEYFEKALALNPTGDDYFSYGTELLRTGDFKKGLKYFEYRFSKETDPNPYPNMLKPRWDGKTDLSDKTLLVQCEQGYGDSIQFGRYLNFIKAKKVIFRVHHRLVDLFKSNFPQIEIVSKKNPIEDLNFDYHIPLLSLLEVLGVNANNIPLAQGYLNAEDRKIEEFKQKYFNNGCFKIGISWRGGIWGNKYRHIGLEDLYCLTKLPNTKIYSLQNDPEKDIEKALQNGVEIINIGSNFESFSDTAVAIENMDLIISIDNVITNLAGAMGKKTFMLLNTNSDWRWFLNEHQTPWYDSIKIFKKCNENDDWTETIKNTINEIIN